MINKLCIFGVGLIGGSLALALKKANYCNTIVGCSRDEAHLKRAVELGVIDSYTLDQKEAVLGADVVLLAVPIRAIGPILKNIRDALNDNTVITDAGSAKASVINAVKEAFNGVLPSNFVAGHPIAGREKSSVEAAISDLYIDHKVVLTPTVETNESAVNIVTDMWQETGAIVEQLPVKQHDDVLAATSHLPHVLAFTFVNSLSKSNYEDAVFDYAAGGFESFSRTASSDSVMWRDICLENKTAILDSLDAYQKDLAKIKEAISDSNAEEIESLFIQAKTTRDRIIKKT
ncbi:MAG: prephenate dehydrogenase/arogenate dehydrogenase family protein [Cocleimonas sp.]